MKKVSVVILNWNGRQLLEQFLPSVIRYTDTEIAEIIIADNNSEDDSLNFLETDYPGLRIISLSKNYGFAEGYNRALDQIDSQYVVLLNSDVEVTENWLSTAIKYLDTNYDVVALQPKILSYKDKSSFEYAGAAGGFIDIYGYPFCRGRVFSKIEKDTGQYNDITDIFWASGACMIIRLKEYKEVGGLDNNFFAHQEEIDLCWRLNARGKRIVCLPSSVVYHLGGATLKVENPNKTYLNFRNNLLTLYKNLSGKYYRKVMNVRFLLDYLAALQFFVAGKTRSARAVLRARQDFKQMKEEYTQIRKENLEKTKVETPKGMYLKSILREYYIGGRK